MTTTNEDRTIQRKKINGEEHIKIGFSDWIPLSECDNPTYQYSKAERMDFTKTYPILRGRSTTISERSIPNYKPKIKY